VTDYIAAYTRYLTEDRGSSGNTVSSYVRDVTQFVNYLSEIEGADVISCVQEHVERYMAYMTGKGKSSASVARSVASLKSFFGYLVDHDVVRVNPARNTAPVRAERKFPQILTGKEVELFLEQPECVDAKGYRDHAMLELLYATGIRVSELINLDLDDLKDISLAIGEKIVQTSLKSSSEVVKKMIIAATEKLKKTAWAKIYVAQSNSEMELKGDDQLLRELAKLSDNVKIVVMEEADPGTCIIELPHEIIDISANVQMENIRDILTNARA